MRLLLILPLVVAACTDFATPAQLERATIVAVVADPPIVAPGDEARITVVVADATGVLTTLPTRWELGEAFPGIAPMGTLTSDADGATYTAPAMVPPRPDSVPAIDAIAVTVDTADGSLTALKAMAVAATTANPTITALAVGASDGLAGPIAVTKGQTLALSVTTDPAPGADARFAWYTPVGAIQYYQSNPCELIIDDDATTGPLVIVVRDGVGGVAWHAVTLQVQ